MHALEFGAFRVRGAYASGQGNLQISAQQPEFFETLPINPNFFAVYPAATGAGMAVATARQGVGIYSCTGLSGNVLQGISFVSGTDGPWAPGDIVVMRYGSSSF
jgi:hypothetical protein